MTEATTIFQPETAQQAAEFLKAATAQQQAVRIAGADTKIFMGNLPRPTALTISTLGFAELIDYTPEDLTITVGAGMPFALLQQILNQHHQFLPLDPPELEGQTIGGILASNASGPRRLLYGTARDLLIGCRMVLADGSVGLSGGRVVKNVAGYDLHKLMIGAMGTLGLLTEVTFKVVPQPQVIGMGKAVFSSVEQACNAARQCVRSNLTPAVLEIVIIPGDPVANLFFGAEGIDVAVAAQLAGLTAIVQKAGATGTEILPESEARECLHLLANGHRSAELELSNNDEASLVLRASTPLTALPAIHLLFSHLGNTLQTEFSQQVRAGTGISYVASRHCPADATRVAIALTSIRAALASLGGSLVVECAPPTVKQTFEVWGITGDAVPAMQALKNKLDPLHLLNPGLMDI